MMNQLQICVLAMVVMASFTQGVELIENYFKGEKYEPEGRSMEERYPYSSSYIAAASSRQGGPVRPEDIIIPQGRKVGGQEGRDLSFSGLMEQLGLVLHNQLKTRAGEPRNLKTDDGDDTDRSGAAKTPDAKQTGKVDSLHYHFYPHNQHLYQLPECATQQVCNAVYRRLNFTQPLCQCPSRSDPCSASLLTTDQRSIELSMGGPQTRATTVIKTCEPVWSVRECRTPRDWSILALQNTRTGKAHYLVICKCPQSSKLEGPLNHDQPSYAQVPGIRVYGMMCIGRNYRRVTRQVADAEDTAFPWSHLTDALEGSRLLQDLDDPEGAHVPSPILPLPF